MSGIHTPFPIRNLDQLQDVVINDATLANGNIIEWNSTDEVWKNISDGVQNNFISADPTTSDAPNNVADGFYKMKLDGGINKQTGSNTFDDQLSYSTLVYSFPAKQIVEYYNTLPLLFPVAISRDVNSGSVATGASQIITNLGTSAGGVDKCIYDPVQMRAKVDENTWTAVGAPTQFRDNATKGLLNVKWFFQGTWATQNANNRAIINLKLYKSGQLDSDYVLAVSNNAQDCIMSGERTFIGVLEGINWSLDYFRAELLNESPSQAISINLAQFEFKWIVSQ